MLRLPWAFALQPDLLLLDEPTNHLDIEAIERLEGLLLKVPASMVITHDRAFLDRITTRIIELDRGVLLNPGSFTAYEQRKDEELAAEDTARRRFEKFWKQEEAWIRKGSRPAARATKDACGVSSNCVSKPGHAYATGSATFAATSTPVSVQAIWWPNSRG